MPEWLAYIAKFFPWILKVFQKRLLLATIAIVTGSTCLYFLFTEFDTSEIARNQPKFYWTALPTACILPLLFGVAVVTRRLLPHSNATTKALRTIAEVTAIFGFISTYLILVFWKIDQPDLPTKLASIAFSVAFSCALLAAGDMLRKTSYTSDEDRSEAWGLMIQSAQREVQIIGGDLSWLKEHHEKLIERLNGGKKVRLIMPAKHLGRSIEINSKLSELIVAGADIRATSDSATCSARFVIKDPGPDASLLVLEPNRDAHRKKLSRYDMPRNSLFIETAQSLFRSLADLAAPAVILQPTEELVDDKEILSILRARIEHYGDLRDTNISQQLLKPSTLFTCSRYAKTKKLEWAKTLIPYFHETGRPLFSACLMTACREGRATKRMMLPPIVEYKVGEFNPIGGGKRESYVVMDGLHRILAAHLRNPDQAINCIVITSCTKPLPAKKVHRLLTIGQISERVDRHRMFNGYDADNFRKFKELDQRLIKVAN